ncbi:MAG: DUF885 domain-containing protein [Gemmatimonadota bacterium]|nr:DUF885 domain-containing protein [Gemmatimonadota bacterium]
MSDTLGKLLDGYLELRWIMDPVEATDVGCHDHDHLFADYRSAPVREFAAALRSYTASLEEAEADSLDDEIDRTAALHSARHDLLVLEEERPFRRDPGLHLAHALNGLFLLVARNAQAPPARAAAVLARLRALPDFLQRAAAIVVQPATMFVETAQTMIPGGLSLVRDALEDPDLDLTSLDAAELRSARSAAAAALVEFNDALSIMGETSRADFALGRKLFDQKLHTAHMLRENADELYRYGENLRDAALAELSRLAEEISPGSGWREVVDRLRADQPTAASVISEYRAAMERATRLTAENRLVAVPDAAPQVVPTPAYLRSLVPFAAYQSPGAFDEVQVGLFLVTLPDGDGPWRTHCRPELASTAVHEGIPGHHLQILTANRLPRKVRRVLGTPAVREGWALYCESLFAELNLLSPEERFFQAHHLLWRALRILLDVALHTRDLPVASAVRMLRDELGFSVASAEAEVRRYCATPTYQLCYAVGRRDILALREDARAQRGKKFSLADFHAELLGYGALPAVLARWGMGLA